MESLSDKLKSLGVVKGVVNLQRVKPRKDEFPIERVINGIHVENDFGDTFVTEELFPKDYTHGVIPMANQIDIQNLCEWAKLPFFIGKTVSDFAFIDCETSGLAGGTGTYAFMVGIGYQVEEGFKLIQIFMRDPAQETALLASLGSFLYQFSSVVTFNGKTFDIPLLNARHILNGFDPPFSHMGHIDLLPLARRLWRKRLASRALSSLEVEILHLQRTREEVPGWMIPEIYFNYLKTGDARPLEGVFYHNGMDILSLYALFSYLANLLQNPLADPSLPGLDLAALAQLFEGKENYYLAIELYERSLSQGLPNAFFLQTIDRYALLYRRQGKWDQAISLWTKGAENKHIEACIELAKYYEHQEKALEQAIYWTKYGIKINLEFPGNSFIVRKWNNELQKRLERLERKSNPC